MPNEPQNPQAPSEPQGVPPVSPVAPPESKGGKEGLIIVLVILLIAAISFTLYAYLKPKKSGDNGQSREPATTSEPSTELITAKAAFSNGKQLNFSLEVPKNWRAQQSPSITPTKNYFSLTEHLYYISEFQFVGSSLGKEPSLNSSNTLGLFGITDWLKEDEDIPDPGFPAPYGAWTNQQRNDYITFLQSFDTERELTKEERDKIQKPVINAAYIGGFPYAKSFSTANGFKGILYVQSTGQDIGYSPEAVLHLVKALDGETFFVDGSFGISDEMRARMDKVDEDYNKELVAYEEVQKTADEAIAKFEKAEFDSYFKAVLQEIESVVKTIKLEKQS